MALDSNGIIGLKDINQYISIAESIYFWTVGAKISGFIVTVWNRIGGYY